MGGFNSTLAQSPTVSTREWFLQNDSASSQNVSSATVTDGSLIDLQTEIIIGTIAIVVVVIVIVVLVVTWKRNKNKRISNPPCGTPNIPHEMSQPIENNSFISNIHEENETSSHYAQLTRVNHGNNVYATLEFDPSKATC